MARVRIPKFPDGRDFAHRDDPGYDGSARGVPTGGVR